MIFHRHAVYYAPRPGALADGAAAWLEGGHGLPIAGAARYGFHGTLRAPFRAAPGVTEDDIVAAVEALAARLAPAASDGLRVADLHGFLALVPQGDSTAIDALAAAVVEGTDHLRAPLTAEEIARRNPAGLTARERALLDRWGYPYVMEAFRFHLTLTDRLDDTRPALSLAAVHFDGALPQPFIIADLCLFGEDDGGRFHLRHRYALTG
jgi:hypothetical protein